VIIAIDFMIIGLIVIGEGIVLAIVTSLWTVPKGPKKLLVLGTGIGSIGALTKVVSFIPVVLPENRASTMSLSGLSFLVVGISILGYLCGIGLYAVKVIRTRREKANQNSLD